MSKTELKTYLFLLTFLREQISYERSENTLLKDRVKHLETKCKKLKDSNKVLLFGNFLFIGYLFYSLNF